MKDEKGSRIKKSSIIGAMKDQNRWRIEGKVYPMIIMKMKTLKPTRTISMNRILV
jgi:hypothetical protein